MNIKNPIGLSFDFLENGSIKCIEAETIRISLKAETPYSKSGANLWLRKRAKTIEYKALLGPGSNSRFKIEEDSFIAAGSWSGVDYECVLQLSKSSLSWRWSIDITNTTEANVELDLVYVQDVGLKQNTASLINEYYVSQYLERRILEDQRYGSVICCRQNMRESVGNPWLMLACRNRAVSASVDGMQFYGRTYRATGIPEGLLGEMQGGEYSGESSVLALQEAQFELSAGENHKSVFIATYMHDHPQATSDDDLNILTRLDDVFDYVISSLNSGGFHATVKNLFNTSGFLPVNDLNDQELDTFFGKERRHCEFKDDDLLSFFCNKNNHVMLRTKEIITDRPHAHIMQAQAGFVPDENIVSTAAHAFGVFNSHITQGNTNFNILLSVVTSQFNLSPETGQRIFVEIDDRIFLLGVPSAFEIGLNHCRWIYKHDDYCFEVLTWTSKTAPRVNMNFRVINGRNVRLIITHHLDVTNGWNITAGGTAGEYLVRPRSDSMIAGKFPGAQFRIIVNSIDSDYTAGGDELIYGNNKSQGDSLFVFNVRDTSHFCMSFIGEVCSIVQAGKIKDANNQWVTDCRNAQSVWSDLSLNMSLEGEGEDIAAIREIMPWYGMNALTHYLTPYGLEQFSGAAWGTRDIAQGPFDLLLCMGKYAEARQVLCMIFSNQNPDGGWPQWWMFDSYSHIRADSSHGDVYYWCIIALSNYIKATGDLKLLDKVLPYYNENHAVKVELTQLSEHVERLIKKIIDSFMPGTAMVPFGGGDWNDSLQPVSRELAQKMISSWTVEMNYQAFTQYQSVYEQSGERGKAEQLKEVCVRIKDDFNRYLIKDKVVAGYGLVGDDGSISLLLHPGDVKTGIRYSILPMNRGIISGIFTEEQARHHQFLIEKHLKGPDGARLMDRPLHYRGGIQKIFQRAESSTFFGREIGLMYIHEHIRYAEAQALTGRADAFMKALRQAIPVAYSNVVPCGDIRQSNCYYSSSDVAFRNRYEADELYDEILKGKITLRGGWRVYSSGPGIYISLIVTRLLGLRIEQGNIIIDPVIPASLDGLSASLNLLGNPLTFKFAVREGNFSPKVISVNGSHIEFSCEQNKYRKGGAVISTELFLSKMDKQDNIIDVQL